MKIYEICKYLIKLRWTQDIYNCYLIGKNRVYYSKKPCINGVISILNQGIIKLGDNIVINSGKKNNQIGGDSKTNLIVEDGGYLEIGNNVGISNSTIFCRQSIKIGDNVLIGGGCKIYDTDFHAKDYEIRMEAFVHRKRDLNALSKSISISNGAWIGGHCIILKGVTIGEKSIIGAGSVVTKNVPPMEIWAGNPAKYIKDISKSHFI